MHRLRLRAAALIAAVVIGGAHGASPVKLPVAPTSGQWEREVAALEASARTNPPPAQGILFVGSSSIRLWESLAADFPGKPVINRGFGGCHLADVVFYLDRLVFPARPQQILVYAGDNDLAAGKPPERVVQDFKTLVGKIRQTLPEARISFIAIKPSPSREHLIHQVRQANEAVAAVVRGEAKTDFIDVFTPMLAPDGQPRHDLFREDQLHLNGKGYALWREVIGPYLRPE